MRLYMIPSFLLVGISKDFENIARKIQENALAEKNGEGMAEMVTQLAHICSQACIELKGELLTLT